MKQTTLLLPLFLVVVGCAPTPVTREPSIDVVAVTNTLTINLSGSSLTQAEQLDIAQFIERKGLPSNLMVKLESYTPKGKKQLNKVKKQLLANGLYPSQITMLNSEVKGSGDIAVFVESYRAKVPKCHAGKAAKSVMSSYKSQNNFGCANASALAQMVANPKDLIVGQSLGNTEGEKAVSTIDGYLSPSVSTQQSNQNNTNGTIGAAQ